MESIQSRISSFDKSFCAESPNSEQIRFLSYSSSGSDSLYPLRASAAYRKQLKEVEQVVYSYRSSDYDSDSFEGMLANDDILSSIGSLLDDIAGM